MLKHSLQFIEAAKDYLYLLERKYAQKSALKMVGDKYQLIGKERSMLYRGVVPAQKSILRQSKMVNNIHDGVHLQIDGYNVIRTIGSYLLGKPVFIAMDGLLRDASEMHRSTLQKKILNKTIDLVINYLLNVKPSQTMIYLDEPVSKSGELAARLNEELKKNSLIGNAVTVHSPDYHLKEVCEGIICTADSAIIDHCHTKVFDLARKILDLNYQPDYINFKEMFR